LFRRIGSIKSIVTSGYWTAFKQHGNIFELAASVPDISAVCGVGNTTTTIRLTIGTNNTTTLLTGGKPM